jgi:ATP-dependent DNA ligase
LDIDAQERTLAPPVAPMLGRLARQLPEGDYSYEPKWDGFRCLAFKDGDDVDLRSRHDRPLARYFPEVAEALRALPVADFVLDGELVALRDGRLDFAALMGRLHPATSRVERLRRETPAVYVCFDALAAEGEVLCERPLRVRRRRLEELVGAADGEALRLTTITDDRDLALTWLHRHTGGGLDGVMAKEREGTYVPGRRRMIKVKLERTADCVVAGARPVIGEPAVASLLLGLYDDAEALHHVGVATAFPRTERRRLWADLAGLAVSLADHPWSAGYLVSGGPMGRLRGAAGRWTPDMELDWLPLEPSRVCEVTYDQVDGARFRHAARFRRWRPDREARSCRLDQLDLAARPVAAPWNAATR